MIAVLRQFITMLRDGYSLVQCFQHVAEYAPEPTAEASRQLLRDLKEGIDLPAALDAMKKRVRSNYFGRVVGTMQVQFREGGNLAERFDILEAEFRKDLGDLRWANKREYAEQLIIPAIAESVFFSFQADERRPKDQLLAFLAQKEMVLVTDNWEHLLDGAPLLNEILRVAPNVKILATSREKLHLLGETVYVLQGMQFPSWESPEDALEYDSVQLLMQTAQRVKPDWQITKENLDFVARVCRLTQGMPLGILLAISWLDMLSISEIAEEIATSSDFLEAHFADVPERQQSIRAIFTYAWNKLSEEEQQIFMKLSVFRGGFSREAAKAVAGANLPILHRLLEKALVLRLENQSYDLHELLRQYAEEKLKLSGEEDVVRGVHSAYYLSFIGDLNNALLGSRQKEAVEAIIATFDNLRVAWFWAIEQNEFQFLPSAGKSLMEYAKYYFTFREVYLCLHAATSKLFAESKDNSLNYAQLLIYQAECEMTLSRKLEEKLSAKAHCEEALAIAEAHQGQYELYRGKRVLLGVMTFFRQGQEAVKIANEIYHHAQNLDSAFYLAESYQTLGLASVFVGAWDDVYKYQVTSYELFKKTGNRSRYCSSVHNLGVYFSENCDYSEAESYLKEALAIRQDLKFYAHAIFTQNVLAMVLCELGKFEEAEKHFHEIYRIAQDLGEESLMASAFIGLAKLEGAKGNYAHALQMLRDLYGSTDFDKKHLDLTPFPSLLGMNAEWDEMRQILLELLPKFSLNTTAQRTKFDIVFDHIPLLAVDWGVERATEILSFLLNHPKSARVFAIHAFTQKCRDDFRAELGEAVYEAAWEKGKTLDLQAICQEILGVYGKN